ncbi:hypothetical protein [Pseudomonas sp. KCJK9044]|uniref:hypothetical protein n=1 Tax=Pseudomonas sp. KCJK9044 TaxID=3344562 RepID=UPI0039069249
MKNLKDFIVHRDATEAGQAEMSKSKDVITNSLKNVSLSGVNSASLGMVAGTIFSRSKKERRFAEELVEVAHSEAFLDEFSQAIDKPQPGETEDQFVARAKAAFKRLLSKKLDK